MSLRVLITGAPGWLGTRLAEALAGRVAELAAYVRPYADADLRCLVGPDASASELEAWGLRIVRGDVRDPASLRQAMDGVDLVFHLVGIIHPRRVREFYAINTLGTRHVLEAAIAGGVRRIVYVSSNAAAGVNVERTRLMAEHDALRPYGHYGRSKFLAERAIAEAHDAGRIEGVILRPCWYYGPYQPPRQTRFFRMIQGGRPPLFGDGRNLRSMSYTDNVAQALLLAGRSDKASGQTYWIADEQPYSTAEIYGTLARLLAAPDLRPRRFPATVSTLCRAADAALQGAGLFLSEIHVAGVMNQDIACSIEKARRELGYRPAVALEEGMRRSIDWCRSAGTLLAGAVILSLGLLGASPARAAGPFDSVETALSELTNTLALAQDDAASSPSDPSCRIYAAPADILRDVARVSTIPSWRSELRGAKSVLLHDVLCRSHAAGRPLCEELAALGDSSSNVGRPAAQRCALLYQQDLMMKMVVSGEPAAAAISACHEMVHSLAVMDPGNIDLAATEAFCRVWQANWETPKTACRMMFSAGIFISPSPEWRSKCPDVLRVLVGDKRFCAEIGSPGDPHRRQPLMTDSQSCLDYAAFRSAHAAQSPERCGNSGLCRVFLGAPDPCRAETGRVRDWYCAGLKTAAERIRAVDTAFSKANAAVDAVQDAPAQRARYSVRLQSLAQQRDRLFPDRN